MRGNWKGHCTSFVYALFIGMIVLFVTSSLKDEVRVTPVLSSSRNVLPRDIPKPQSFGGRRDNEAPTGFAFGPIQGSSQNVAPPQKLVIMAGETEARQSTYAQLILPSFPTAIPNVFLNDIPVSEYKNPLPTFLHHPKSGGTTMKKCLTNIADQSGLTITPFLCGKDRLSFDENLLRGLYHGNSFDLAAGDVSMGTCKRMPAFRSCAYYTIVREPYDRAISQYFFCLGGGHTSTSCENKTVEEYVLNVGSLFLRQLVYETTCSPRTASSSNKIEDSDRPWRCAVNYQLRLSNEDRQRLVDHLIQEMESIFAVIGITEEFEQSLELIQDALNISFYDTCRDYRYNVGPVDSQTKASKKALEREKVEAKRTLLSNPEIREVLHPDILLYEKARQIFEKQKEIYLRKKKKNQV